MFIYIAIFWIQIILIANTIRLTIMDSFAFRLINNPRAELSDREIYWINKIRAISVTSQFVLFFTTFAAIIYNIFA